VKNFVSIIGGLSVALVANVLIAPFQISYGEEARDTEEVLVTGSRIRRNPLNEVAPIMDIGELQLDRSGLTNLGDTLQDLPITGSSINSQFNVPGNSGFPQDGSGIGAGATQVSLRNVGAKRTLILVDGKRWIAGASASGVPSAVDLNTIPDNVIERIEILQDGASAIYGSDAIGGVVNIITKDDFEGFKVETQTGQYLSDNDGESTVVSAMWGGGNDRTHLVISGSYSDERGVETANRSRSAFPNPDATSCDVSDTFCSSFTPQGRFVMASGFGLYRDGVLDPTCTVDDSDCSSLSLTLNDGVLNDGMSNVPVFDPMNPFADDFHAFSNADRFNYNGPGFNFLRTPNERVNFYGSVRHEISDTITLVAKASHTNRSSETKAAPEPLCFGVICGTTITRDFVVSALNPFNPFDVDLSVADNTMVFFGRRPLESGGRLFFQDVNTYFASAGLEGEWNVGDRTYFWDLTGSYGDNRGFQEKRNSHNAARLQVAMGDPAVCAATPGCVPFNYFGGQGPDGSGSFTQEMLDYVTYTQRDFSEQTLKDFAFNITGGLADLAAGPLSFAAGLEFRDHEGSFRPDPIAASGETAGIPSGGTAGGFDVTEYYAEVNIPIVEGASAADYLEASLAVRSSDYSNFGSEGTYKANVLYRPVSNFSLRGSVSTGLRAPGIGELFGGAAREDFGHVDPCSDVLAIAGADNGGRDDPQPQNIIDNCAALGVPTTFVQLNPQLSAVSAGNSALQPETSDAFGFGLVYSADWVDNVDWIEGFTASVDYYDLEIDDAVQGRDPGDVVDACVETLDPFFCDLTPRAPGSGALDTVENTLQNIGKIEASGYDVMLEYRSPDTRLGEFGVRFNATHLNDYIEKTFNPDGSLSENDRTGSHTDETFQRAFPDWRATTNVDWTYGRWNGNLAFRWTDEMTIDTQGLATSSGKLDSETFTDLQFSYTPDMLNESLTLTFGVNNLFDTDPPVCFPCGVIGVSTVVHDLPGRVGYIKAAYRGN